MVDSSKIPPIVREIAATCRLNTPGQVELFFEHVCRLGSAYVVSGPPEIRTAVTEWATELSGVEVLETADQVRDRVVELNFDYVVGLWPDKVPNMGLRLMLDLFAAGEFSWLERCSTVVAASRRLGGQSADETRVVMDRRRPYGVDDVGVLRLPDEFHLVDLSEPGGDHYDAITSVLSQWYVTTADHVDRAERYGWVNEGLVWGPLLRMLDCWGRQVVGSDDEQAEGQDPEQSEADAKDIVGGEVVELHPDPPDRSA